MPAFLIEADVLGAYTPPVTVRITPVFTTTEAVDVEEALVPNSRVAQVRLPSTVSTSCGPITMSSVAAGITPPGQGAFGTVELQLPLPPVVMVAAYVVMDKTRRHNESRLRVIMEKDIGFLLKLMYSPVIQMMLLLIANNQLFVFLLYTSFPVPKHSIS